MMMAPEVMVPAKKAMMGEKLTMPAMVSKEMAMQAMMKDKEVMGMVAKGAMAEMPDDKKMLSDDMMLRGDMVMIAGHKMMKDAPKK